MPISPINHHLPFVRNEFSDSAQNSGLDTTLKTFGLRRLNKSAWAHGPLRYMVFKECDDYAAIPRLKFDHQTHLYNRTTMSFSSINVAQMFNFFLRVG